MSLTILDVEQGTDEWHDARRGIITASVIGQLITAKTLQPANNDTSRAVTLHLIAERITGYTEPTYPSRDMERGTNDEPLARDVYHTHIAPVRTVGFMINDSHGAPIGYSPDGLVGDDGLIEIKSRRQKVQLATFLNDEVPLENMAQIQCGLLVSGRKWCDYVSFCGGMHLYRKRVFPDLSWFDAIATAARTFELTAASTISDYAKLTRGLPLTERPIDMYEEMRV